MMPHDNSQVRFAHLVALASRHQELGRLDEAERYCRMALAMQPASAEVCKNLAVILNRQGKSAEAATECYKALALRPHFAEAHNCLGIILTDQHNLSEADAHFRKALAIAPDYAAAHYNRTMLRRVRPGDEELADLEELALRMGDFSVANKTSIHFALGKALDDIGEYAGAFGHFVVGNNLKRQELRYDEMEDARTSELIAQTFTSALFSRFQGSGDQSPVPIFIVGMPRSGSTLVEQILASHPQVYGAGELVNLTNVANGISDAKGAPISYPAYIPALDGTTWQMLGRSYLEHLPHLPAGKTRITDKMPTNFRYIGLIRLLLPNAKIIHTRRNPADTCFSCFSQLFTTGQEFTYDLGELGRYYRRYSELMARWRSILPPDAILDVSYEDLIDDFDTQARRLVEYCGLDWDERCLSFHKTDRIVATASKVQVRQPLYRSSLQRWRKYESHLGPLLAELDMSLPSVSSSEKVQRHDS